jgi:hypothetical protein
LPACPVRSASRSLKVVATALKEHGAYAPDVGAATLHPFEGRVERKTVHRCERAESRRLIWRWLTSVNGAFTIVKRTHLWCVQL